MANEDNKFTFDPAVLSGPVTQPQNVFIMQQAGGGGGSGGGGAAGSGSFVLDDGTATVDGVFSLDEGGA